MKNVTSVTLIDFVKNLQNYQLQTIGGRNAFIVNAVAGKIQYFTSKGKPRVQDSNRLDRICERFNHTHSFKTSDYTDLTVSASYALALIKAFLTAEKGDVESIEDVRVQTKEPLITIFHDRLQKNAHVLFQAWRAANPNGFFLNRKAPVLLHQSSCPHLGTTDWKADGKNWGSLTVNAKICARTIGELETWASNHNLSVRPCQDCKPTFDAPGILPPGEYQRRLQRVMFDADDALFEAEFAGVRPERVEVKTFRFVRDTRLSRAVKEVHQNKCQICGTSVLMADGSGYSEGHHIRPLGKNHGGPDDASNIICLCPNHHVALDACAMKINLEELRVHARHKIDPEQVEYHNELVERLAAALV